MNRASDLCPSCHARSVSLFRRLRNRRHPQPFQCGTCGIWLSLRPREMPPPQSWLYRLSRQMGPNVWMLIVFPATMFLMFCAIALAVRLLLMLPGEMHGPIAVMALVAVIADATLSAVRGMRIALESQLVVAPLQDGGRGVGGLRSWRDEWKEPAVRAEIVRGFGALAMTLLALALAMRAVFWLFRTT